MSNVFVIINEWTSIDDAQGSELVGAKFFIDEDHAWAALKEIAEAHNTLLSPTETSVAFANSEPHLSYDEYYIQELTRG